MLSRCRTIAARLRTLTASEAGLTMVELLVASTLLLMVLGTAGVAVVNSMNSGYHASDAEKATANSANAADTIGQDLHQAIALGRMPQADLTPDEMLAMITQFDGYRVVGRNVTDIRDVLEATPTTLIFRSIAVPQPGATGPAGTNPLKPECVEYQQLSDWSLIRSVYYDTGSCQVTSSVIDKETLLPALPASLRPSTAGIFTYGTISPSVAGEESYLNCNEKHQPAGTTLATTGAAKGALTVNNIVEVDVDVESYYAGHGSAAQAATRDPNGGTNLAVDLRSRQGHDYLYALGCAQ